MKNIAVGIDIGGTNTAIGLVDEAGNVLAKGVINTPSHGDVNAYVSDMAGAVKKLIEELDKSGGGVKVLGIGLGAPNGNYYNGTIEHAPNLSFKGIVHLVDLMKKQFPSYQYLALTNDANAAALGELIYGGAKGMRNFVMYTLGTGVGSGIITNGDLYYGHDGFAGECGHTMLIPGGRHCGCGSLGHLEAYCSAPGMKRTAFELMAKYNADWSILADKSFKELDSKMIYEAAIKGDKIALEVFELTGRYLGQALADTVHHLAPQAIFLFGGPTAAGDLIFKPTIASMEEHLLPIFKKKIQVLPSKLNAGDAAIVGASALVWNEAKNS